jgi:hypothetical protein
MLQNIHKCLTIEWAGCVAQKDDKNDRKTSYDMHHFEDKGMKCILEEWLLRVGDLM